MNWELYEALHQRLGMLDQAMLDGLYFFGAGSETMEALEILRAEVWRLMCTSVYHDTPKN